MPNTKSAERRMRSNARKHMHNRSVTSKLRGLEKNFRALVTDGKKDEASNETGIGMISVHEKRTDLHQDLKE